jgi:NitT/TauT family transport system ATP-binding protein
MLEVKDLQKSYDNFNIAVDFTIAKGEFFSLLGPSGCGKTTTLRLIAGLEDCDSGSIKLSGLDITKLPPQKRNLGLVFQDYALFPHLSVTENILYGLRKEKREIKERRLKDLLALFKLEDLKDRSVRRLSGGESQRVALARALAVEPNLLLLDEPFSSLDYQNRLFAADDIGQIIRSTQKTALLVTHDLSEAVSLADRVIILTNRPASISKIVPITFDLEKDTPLHRRNAPEFKNYFNTIWEELNQNE